MADTHLFISPLCPKVPSKGCCNPRERKNHKQPKKAVNNVELSVEDIADPMDGASASVFLCGLNQGCFLQCILHCMYSFALCSLKLNYATLFIDSKSARLQLIPTLGKGKANVQDLESFALTTTDLALSHLLHEFCTLLLVARLCLS